MRHYLEIWEKSLSGVCLYSYNAKIIDIDALKKDSVLFGHVKRLRHVRGTHPDMVQQNLLKESLGINNLASFYMVHSNQLATSTVT